LKEENESVLAAEALRALFRGKGLFVVEERIFFVK
jgi:hypothetical protein